MDKAKKMNIRNSTAEFLIFTGQSGESTIEARYEDETIWLSQKLMAELFAVNIRTISEHLLNILNSKRTWWKFSYPEIPDNCRRRQKLQYQVL